MAGGRPEKRAAWEKADVGGMGEWKGGRRQKICVTKGCVGVYSRQRYLLQHMCMLTLQSGCARTAQSRFITRGMTLG